MIEVRIAPDKVLPRVNNSLISVWFQVHRQLRDAGVPLSDNAFVLAPENGVLEIERDDLGLEEWVFRWRPQ